MTVTPQGMICLCKVPITNDYKNQLTFADLNDQFVYFSGKMQRVVGDYTYIKKDNVIKVGINIDEIIGCNYLFYRNTGFTDKRYYCFINKMEYINENCTAIFFETDCFQTWYWEIEYHPCFVEREHVSDDTIGLHTVPENLETGEYIVTYNAYDNRFDDVKYIIQCTEWATSTNKPLSTNYGGIPMAGGAYICDNINIVTSILTEFSNNQKADAVYNLYIVPSILINNTSESAQYSGQTNPVELFLNIQKPTKIANTYTPKNQKLFTFPYCYLMVSNNSGVSNILHYERFKENGGKCGFQYKGVPVVGGSIKCSPINYDEVGITNEEEGIVGAKYPSLNWSENTYLNWISQNSVNLNMGLAASGLSMAGGIAMAMANPTAITGVATIANSAWQIANDVASVYKHSLQPNSAKGNTNAGDINVCSKKNGFFFYMYSIKEEYARIIDNYWSMYGYKVNTVKIPNNYNRLNWNYIKTVGCNFTGEIPQEDLKIIRQMYDNGVTFWHNADTIFDYSRDNRIV